MLHLLAHLLGAPEHGSLEALGELSAAWPWLTESVQQARSVSLQAWQAEHTRLFLSSFPFTVCPPFASAYLHGCLSESSFLEELCSFYGTLGLRATVGFEDFLGTMFECAACLLMDRSDDTKLEWFWSHCLEPWVPHFTKDLQQGAKMQLYQAMATQISILFPPSLQEKIPIPYRSFSLKDSFNG